MDPVQNNQNAAPAMDTKQKNAVMAILSYIGPLVIVSFIVAKSDPFVKFHIKQGALLFAAEVVVWVLGSILWGLWPLWDLANLAALVLSIIGIVNAAKGEEKALPFIGHWSKHVPV